MDIIEYNYYTVDLTFSALYLGLCLLIALSIGISVYVFPKLEPQHLLIGLTGVSLCIAVTSIAIMTYNKYIWASSFVLFLSLFLYPFFFRLFATIGETYLSRKLTGVKINKPRIFFEYISTLPVFLFYSETPIHGFFLHFPVFFFLIEASLVQKATIFKKNTNAAKNATRVQIRTLEVKEEEKNTRIYKFFWFLRVLT